MLASDGSLYGSAAVGGAYGLWTLFRLSLSQPPLVPKLKELVLSQYGVVGGNPVTPTVSLGWAAPAGGATVALSSDSTLASVPPSVTIPAGADRTTLTISTRRTKKTKIATITATYNGSRVTAMLAVTP